MRVFLALLLVFLPFRVWAADFYFSDSGSDAAACTQGSPCETLSKAESVWSGASPGDRILFQCGDTFREEDTQGLASQANGTAGNPITIGAWGSCTGSNKPVITNLTVESGFVNHSGNTWRKDNVNTASGRNWLFDRQLARWIGTTDGETASCPASVNQELEICIDSGNELYVWTEGGDPDSQFDLIERNTTGFSPAVQITHNNIVIDGVAILGGGVTLRVSGVTNFTMRNSEAGFSYHKDESTGPGGTLGLNSLGNPVVSNTVSAGTFTYEDNWIHDGGRDCIHFELEPPDTVNMTGNLVENCWNHNAVNLSKDGAGTFAAGTWTISNNEIRNSCDGVLVTGDGNDASINNVIMSYNYIHGITGSNSEFVLNNQPNCGTSGRTLVHWGSGFTGTPLSLIGNIVANNVGDAIRLQGSGITLTTFRDNLVYNTTGNSAFLIGGGINDLNTISNSSFIDTDNDDFLIFCNSSSCPFDSVNNNFFYDSNRGNNNVLRYNSTNYTNSSASSTFGFWQSNNVAPSFNSGQTLFVSAQNGDWNVAPGSSMLGVDSSDRESGPLKSPIFETAEISGSSIFVTYNVFDDYEPISACSLGDFTVRCDGVIQNINACNIGGGLGADAVELEMASTLSVCGSVTVAWGYGAVEDSALIGGTLNSRLRSSTALEHDCPSGLCPAEVIPFGFAGRFNEPVHNTTTDPDGIVINASGCESTIEGGPSGATYLVNAGTCSGNSFNLSNVTIYPNNGALVTFSGTATSTFSLGGNVTMAAIKVDAANSDRCITVNGDNVIVRNSLILGGDTGDCVRIESGDDILIDGNLINGGAGPNGSSGHNVHVRGGTVNSAPTNVVISRNKLYKDASEVGWGGWNGTEDLFQQRNSKSLIVEKNWFVNMVSDGEELADFKESIYGFTTIFRYNFLDGRAIDSSKDCMILQVEDNHISGASTNTIDAYGNIFYGCDLGSAHGAFTTAASDSKPNEIRGNFSNNLVIMSGDSDPNLSFREFSDATVAHNTVINGDLLFLSGAGPEPENDFIAFRDNLFFSLGGITNNQFSASSCTHNALSSSSGSLHPSCSNTLTQIPSFSNCTTANTILDCVPKNSAFIASPGSDGFTRGALFSPQISSAEIGGVSAGVITIGMLMFTTYDTRPIQNIDTSRITVRYDGSPQTISSVGVSNQSTIILNMASTATSETDVTLQMTENWCTDSADLGFARDIIGHEVNARCLSVAEFSITNDIGGGGGGPVDITTGLIAYLKFNGSLTDETGNTTPTYSGVTPTFEAGQVNSAIVFDGSDWVSLGTHAITGTSLFPGPGEVWSVAAFFKTADRGTVVASAVGNQANRDYQTAVDSQGQIDNYLRGGETSSPLSGYNDSTFHHVAVTWNGTTAALYIDGDLISGNMSVGTEAEDTGEHILIGARTGGTGFRLTGSVDEVRIYDIALSAEQVVALTLFDGTGDEGDTEAPTIPGNLQATANSSSQITLTWDASTDNEFVDHYNIEQCDGAACADFASVGASASSPFSDTGLTASSLYRYRISAEDSSGNISAFSSIAEATTEAVTLFPAGRAGGSFSGGNFE